MALSDVKNDVKEKIENVKADVEIRYEDLKKKSMVIRLGLLVFVITAAVMFAMVVFATETLKRVVFNDFLTNGHEIVDARAVETQSIFENYLYGLSVYANNDVVLTGDNEAVIDWLHEHTNLKDPAYDYMFFCGEDGTTYRDTGLVGAVGGILERDYYKAIMKEGRDTYIGNALISKTSGQWVVPVTRAAKDANGKIFGFFTAMINIHSFSELVGNIKIGERGYLFVVDANGLVIGHKDANKLYSPVPEGSAIESLVSQKNNGYVLTTPEGEAESFVLSYHLPSLGWTVCLVQAKEDVYKAGKSAQDIIFIFGCFVTLLVAGLTIFMLRMIFKDIQTVTGLVEGIASGEADLTIRLPVKSNTEIGSVRIAVNKFIMKLQSIVKNLKGTGGTLKEVGDSIVTQIENTHSTISQITGTIKEVHSHVENQINSVEGTASVVSEISKNIDSLNSLIQNQSATVVEASAAVEQMLGNISSVDNSVNKMADQFSTLESETQQGIEKNNIVNGLVQQLAEQSESMMDANMIIQSIAEQTNLLAMNAAIEAAHAGEAGKGFSVVADEIRKLAETSAEQSMKIGEELTAMQNGISSAVAASDESEKTFISVSSHINATGDLVTHIKTAMKEQSTGSQQILLSLKNMNSTTNEVRSASEEMEKGGSSILQEISVLQNATAEIKTAMEEINSGAGDVTNAANELEDVSKTLKQSISEIKDEIDLFKV